MTFLFAGADADVFASLAIPLHLSGKERSAVASRILAKTERRTWTLIRLDSCNDISIS